MRVTGPRALGLSTVQDIVTESGGFVTVARIVGTRTGGQVLGGANFTVGHGFVIRFPAAGWYSWSGAVVEGCGVQPEVDVPLSIDALRHGNDSQLETALAEVQAM